LVVGSLPFGTENFWVFSPIKSTCIIFTLVAIRVLGMKDNKRKRVLLPGCSGWVQLLIVSFEQFFWVTKRIDFQDFFTPSSGRHVKEATIKIWD